MNGRILELDSRLALAAAALVVLLASLQSRRLGCQAYKGSVGGGLGWDDSEFRLDLDGADDNVGLNDQEDGDADDGIGQSFAKRSSHGTLVGVV